ncbi:glycosyltransferase family 2 protein [Sphingomonas daechungensis]|uniref:glycosyltransferase family 2 protein n=1 Tax=Sphingomonas daechungensis TaxID=1176646 RepID=UPI003782F298
MVPREQSISVVMPVHNAMPHLDVAVRSILDQTHQEFEFVILDDGSTDGSTQKLREWAGSDARIRLFESKNNLGPVGSSNKVIELASNSLIARMDADDVSLPTRLERQLRVFRELDGACLIACACDVIDAGGRTVRGTDLWRLSRESWFAPFAHGSALFPRQLSEDVGGYREACAFWEDQDLFARMLIAGNAKVVTIPETLYRVRYSRVSTRVASSQQQVEEAVDRMYRSVDLLTHGELYEDLLQSAKADRLDPRVFIATGSLSLWAGERPRLLGRLLKTGATGPNFRTVSAMVWTLWASLGPSSLRAFMKMLLALRNAATGREEKEPIEWDPPHLLTLREKFSSFPSRQ